MAQSEYLQQVAIIDLGSNTTRLIVMAYHPGLMYKLVDEIRERVKLAEGLGAPTGSARKQSSAR